MRIAQFTRIVCLLALGLFFTQVPVASAISAKDIEQYLAVFEPPPGWNLLQRGSTTALLAENGLSSLTITVEPYADLALKQTALEIAYQLDGGLPRWSNQAYAFAFVNPHGLTGAAALTDLDGESWLLTILIGGDQVLLELIASLTSL